MKRLIGLADSENSLASTDKLSEDQPSCEQLNISNHSLPSEQQSPKLRVSLVRKSPLAAAEYHLSRSQNIEDSNDSFGRT
jgi:hypothetical protein